MADDDSFAEFIKTDPPPDLQSLVRKAGERYAASLGVPYDPKNHPEHAATRTSPRKSGRSTIATWRRGKSVGARG